MGLRPGKTCRTLDKVAWARFSKRKPRKSFVKAMPHRNLNVYNMGDVKGKFDLQFDLATNTDQQRRDNAIESGRQAANKFLEKLIPNGYHFKVRAYPHNVIRENKMIAGAGADRLQKGMRKSFGRATTRGARLRTGQVLFTIKTTMVNRANVLEAFQRAKKKLGSQFDIIEKQIPN